MYNVFYINLLVVSRMKEAAIRKVNVTIEDERVFNLMTYLTTVENYTFVGNESEVWLENLDHPKVQLIYINDRLNLTEAHATYISSKMKLVAQNLKRMYWMPRIASLVLNFAPGDDAIIKLPYATLIGAHDVASLRAHPLMRRFFPKITQMNLTQNIQTLVMTMQIHSYERSVQQLSLLHHTKKPWVIWIFTAILFIIFAFVAYQSQRYHINPIFLAIHHGATYKPLIIAGEYWRLIGASFIHIDFWHLLFNALFIFQFGKRIEHIFGHWRLIIIIYFSALLGGLASFGFSSNFSIGASTVAYGFLGVMVFLAFEMRKIYMPFLKTNVLPMLAFSIVFSLFMPNIDHFGHIGGFFGGFLGAAFIGLPKFKFFWMRSALVLLITFFLVNGLWIQGNRLYAQADFSSINQIIVLEYTRLGNAERAAHMADILNVDVEQFPWRR